ncbi:MAG: 3-hydroxyacyl-ACP dehydratase FabZ family protein [Thermodesulfobacteriota bacterium]
MAGVDPQVTALLPHRPPFLWVDRIIECGPESIITEKYIPQDLDIFEGHYPDHPILPGVILCEALFQSGALLIAHIQKNSSHDSPGMPVLSRILMARFKRQVGPGDTVTMEVKLKEKLASAWFLKGSLRLDNKVALQVEFSCTLAPGKSDGNSP